MANIQQVCGVQWAVDKYDDEISLFVKRREFLKQTRFDHIAKNRHYILKSMHLYYNFNYRIDLFLIYFTALN